MNPDPTSQRFAALDDERPVAKRAFAQAFRNTGFVSCACLLLVLAVAFNVWINVKGIHLKKEAVPAKINIRELKKNRLGPYRFERQHDIEHAARDALGTDEYIHWTLIDTDVEDGHAPERYVTFFVTYYTGKSDQVPHVPEVCYAGSGHQMETDDVVQFDIEHKGRTLSIPVHVLWFEGKRTGGTNMIVMYLFNVNGKYRATRNDVRMAVGDSRYAYFSKLEIRFGTDRNVPTEKVALEAGRKFMKTVLPVLIDDYWPDWDHDADAPAEAVNVASKG